MKNRGKLSRLERDLVEGMEQFLDDLRHDAPIAEKYTCRRVVLDVQTQAYRPKDVRATRLLLNASQPVFAQFLGVSAKTVKAWEQGQTPSDMACRFMDEIRRNPAYWRNRLRQSVKIKAG